jgi:hypothetical protein
MAPAQVINFDGALFRQQADFDISLFGLSGWKSPLSQTQGMALDWVLPLLSFWDCALFPCVFLPEKIAAVVAVAEADV